MTLPDLLAALTEIAERVNHADRRAIFEALRRLRHAQGYVVKGFVPPTPEMERFWGIR